jgi:serine O-acetyltransferase
MLNDVKAIFSGNTFHARIILLMLYFEKRCLLKLPFKILRKLISQALYHCEIHPDTLDLKAITTLRLPHPFLIIIHRSSKIGYNSTIFQGVTIGVKENGKIEAASIGNNFYIGCNSTILGPVNIVDDVTIGAHSLVLADVTKAGVYYGLIK